MTFKKTPWDIKFTLRTNTATTRNLKENPKYFDDRSNQLPIWIDYSFENNRLRLPTGVSVNPHNWDPSGTEKRVTKKDPFSSSKTIDLNILYGSCLILFLKPDSMIPLSL